MQFRGERSRPFFDLLAQVERMPAPAKPRAVADLGCGAGDLTALLAERWPSARLWGVDSSAEMIVAAAKHAIPDRLTFVLGDLGHWTPPEPLDVLIANASLQWVPDHPALLERLTSALAPGGVLGFQVPGNFEQPSHLALEKLRSAPRWASRLEALPRAAIESPARYLARLAELGLTAEVWETTYWHVLKGEDPVLRWTTGTTLRPLLAALDEAARSELLAEYGALLREAYPPMPFVGTPFPFRRVFAVARRATS